MSMGGPLLSAGGGCSGVGGGLIIITLVQYYF